MAKPLTHNESHVLAVIRKWEPVTAYFVRKALRQSFASSFSESPGSIYPIIERLKNHAFVVAEDGPEAARKSELLSCTPLGERAIREWLLRVDDGDLLPEDPWRTRALFSEILEPSAQIDWLHTLRAAADEELEKINARVAMAADFYEATAAQSARLQIEARLVWLDRLLAQSIPRGE